MPPSSRTGYSKRDTTAVWPPTDRNPGVHGIPITTEEARAECVCARARACACMCACGCMCVRACVCVCVWCVHVCVWCVCVCARVKVMIPTFASICIRGVGGHRLGADVKDTVVAVGSGRVRGSRADHILLPQIHRRAARPSYLVNAPLQAN